MPKARVVLSHQGTYAEHELLNQINVCVFFPFTHYLNIKSCPWGTLPSEHPCWNPVTLFPLTSLSLSPKSACPTGISTQLSPQTALFCLNSTMYPCRACLPISLSLYLTMCPCRACLPVSLSLYLTMCPCHACLPVSRFILPCTHAVPACQYLSLSSGSSTHPQFHRQDGQRQQNSQSEEEIKHHK